MSERKNIDKLFQEKFKDFEMDPPENTWPELERRLKKKKDRKIIPFWWRLSGVAAALVIGLLVGNGLGLFNSDKDGVNGVVIEENAKRNKDANNTILNADPTIIKDAADESGSHTAQQTVIVEASENNASEVKNSNKIGQPQNENNSATEKKGIQQNDYKKVNNNDALVNNNEIQTDNTNHNTSSHNPNKQRIPKKHNQKTNSITNTQTAVVGKHDASPNSQKANDLRKTNQLPENQQKGIKERDLFENKSNTAIANRAYDEQSGGNQNTTDSKSSEAATNEARLNKNSNMVDPVAAVGDKDPEKKLDSTAIAVVAPNALEELLNEKENKVTKEPKLNRWQITSNVAPIYFGSTSGGSPIDSTFASKSKDYNTQVSYGIGLSYAVNKRLTVRTGVNKVSLDYDTNDVQLYASFNEGGFQNLDSPAENEFLNFGRMVSNNRSNATGSRAEANLAAGGEITTDKFTGSINQKMGYIEVPIEVSYAVIDKKFGVNVIAGVSTLFLNENEVMLTSEGYKTNLGEANNLNTTHFSTNVGLGVKYTFLKSFEAKFEPIFKYQLNTFSKDNGDFKPYFFGLYTGLSFRF